MKKDFSLFGLIQAFCVLYIVEWSVSPPLEMDTIYRYAALLMAAVWFVVALIRRIQFDTVHIWSLLFIIVVAVSAYFQSGTSAIIKQIAYYMMFVELIIYSFYKKKGILKELRLIIPIVLILLIYFNIMTSRELLVNPGIARLIVRNDESMQAYMRRGVGGYALIYCQVLIFPSALMWTLQALRKNRLLFILGAGWTASYFFLIANAGYSIAIVSSLLAILMMFLYRRENVIGAIAIALVTVVGAMFALLYMEGLRNSLLTFFDGTAVAKKINDLVSSSESGAAEGSIQVRVRAYSNSLKALLQFPIIGSLWRPASLGGHSAILDNFVKYGIWGGWIFARQVFWVPNDYKNEYKKSEHSKAIISVANAQIIVFSFVAFLDTLPYQLICSLLLLVPIFMEEIKDWTVKEA